MKTRLSKIPHHILLWVLENEFAILTILFSFSVYVILAIFALLEFPNFSDDIIAVAPTVVMSALFLIQLLHKQSRNIIVYYQCLWCAYAIYHFFIQVSFVITHQISIMNCFINFPFVFSIATMLFGFFIIGTVFNKLKLQGAQRFFFSKRTVSSKQLSYGSAIWMNGTEKIKLATNRGVVIGRYDSSPHSPLLHDELESHALTLAPCRSGKFTSVISSNLAGSGQSGWKGPLVIIDTKGEPYAVWHKHRKSLRNSEGNERQVVLLDPFRVINRLGDETKRTDLSTTVVNHYNPLSFISTDSGASMTRDINALIDAFIVPPDPQMQTSNSMHFHEAAKRILAGFIAWVVLSPDCKVKSLITVKDLIATPYKQQFDILEDMVRSDNVHSKLPRDAAKLLMSVASEERGSYISTVTNALSWLNYEEMEEHLATTDFDIHDLCNDNIDIHVIVPGDLTSAVKPWLRLWVTLPFHMVTRKRPKSRILLMIDEMDALGKIDQISKAFHLTSGYGLSIWGLTQNLSDLEKAYGKHDANAILSNAQIVQFFNVSKMDQLTTECISSAIGNTTILSHTHSNSKGSSNNFKEIVNTQNSSNSASYSEAARRLLLPEEVARLPEGAMIVFLRNRHSPSDPILCYKANYYDNPEWLQQALPNPYEDLK